MKEARAGAFEEAAQLCERGTKSAKNTVHAHDNHVWVERVRGNIAAYNCAARDIRLLASAQEPGPMDTRTDPERCPTCGGAVRVVGRSTMHCEPGDSAEEMVVFRVLRRALVSMVRGALFAEDYAKSVERNAACNAPDELTAKDVADGYREGYQRLHKLVSALWAEIETLPAEILDAARKKAE